MIALASFNKVVSHQPCVPRACGGGGGARIGQDRPELGQARPGVM